MIGEPLFPGDVTEKESMVQSPMAPPAVRDIKNDNDLDVKMLKSKCYNFWH